VDVDGGGGADAEADFKLLISVRKAEIAAISESIEWGDPDAVALAVGACVGNHKVSAGRSVAGLSLGGRDMLGGRTGLIAPEDIDCVPR
jgi:hypothetical protein